MAAPLARDRCSMELPHSDMAIGDMTIKDMAIGDMTIKDMAIGDMAIDPQLRPRLAGGPVAPRLAGCPATPRIDMRLAVVSHVVHYQKRRALYAYAPYAREVEVWADLFREVVIAAPCRNDVPPGDCAPLD